MSRSALYVDLNVHRADIPIEERDSREVHTKGHNYLIRRLEFQLSFDVTPMTSYRRSTEKGLHALHIRSLRTVEDSWPLANKNLLSDFNLVCPERFLL